MKPLPLNITDQQGTFPQSNCIWQHGPVVHHAEYENEIKGNIKMVFP